MKEFESHDIKELIEFLVNLPEMNTEQKRRLRVEFSGLKHLVPNITFSGNTREAVENIFSTLSNYEKIDKNGNTALGLFLVSLKEFTGIRQQKLIDDLVDKYQLIKSTSSFQSLTPDKIQQQSNNSVRIFLAHASEDKDEIKQLYERLKSQGYNPWLDVYDLKIGQKWQEVIPKVIKKSDFIILCLSSISVTKPGFLQKEFKLALNQAVEKPPNTIYLLPVKLDRCDVPDIQLVEFGENLRNYQWINYYESDGFKRLLEGIKYQLQQRK
ncbi:MAG: TIR domain-containing protein [Prochloraceae cyanobacterium]|nr:TIR domain-containing protein [Prochloraceae cyanobacterium]